MKLKHIFVLTLSITITLITACNKNEPTNSALKNEAGIKIQQIDTEPLPNPYSSRAPIELKKEEMGVPPDLPPDHSSILTVHHQELDKEESRYDNEVLPDISVDSYESYGIIPGKIQLVFKNGMQVKIGKSETNKILLEEDGLSTSKEFKQIVEAYKVIDGYDLAKGMTQSELTESERRVKNTFKGYIPERSAIQNYTFPNSTNLIALIKKLRALSSIYSANLSYKISPAYTKYQISSISNNASPASVGSTPNDAGFSSYTESTDWWWYNRHKFFLAWAQYSTTMPTIAVIDTGFDTDPAAYDMPNYTGAMRIVFCSAVGVSNCIDVTPGNAAVQEPSGNSLTTVSHGALVSEITGAPSNNSQYFAGGAPNAPIMPIRVMIPNGTAGCTSSEGCMSEENIATAIRYAASQSSVDVINLSLEAGGGDCPVSTASNIIRTEIQSAIAAGKIVVAAAGNNLKSLPYHVPFDATNDSSCALQNATGGEIIVGGLSNDTSISPNRTKGWNNGLGAGTGNGSNYDRYQLYGSTQAIAYVTISAAADNVRVPTYNPNIYGGYRSVDSMGGTSLATPMVSAVAGMMKKSGQAASPAITYTPAQIKSLLVGTADVSRYTVGTTNNTAETSYLGYLLPYLSTPRMIGAYSLNALNAILVAKNLTSYQVIVRMHNIDDSSRATVNSNWASDFGEAYGRDVLWGLNGLASGNKVNFRLYNSSGATTHGYTVFRSNQTSMMDSVGVSGVAGQDYNAVKPVGYGSYVDYTY